MLFEKLRAEATNCSKARLKEIYQQIADEIMAAIAKLEPCAERDSFPIIDFGRVCTAAPTLQIPRFDSMLLMELTICTSLGWDVSNSSTDEVRPSSESFKSRGFCCSRVASRAEIP